MPDFERVLRDIRLQYCKTDEELQYWSAYFKG